MKKLKDLENQVLFVIQYKNNPLPILQGLFRYNSKFLNNHFHFVLYGRGMMFAKPLTYCLLNDIFAW